MNKILHICTDFNISPAQKVTQWVSLPLCGATNYAYLCWWRDSFDGTARVRPHDWVPEEPTCEACIMLAFVKLHKV